MTHGDPLLNVVAFELDSFKEETWPQPKFIWTLVAQYTFLDVSTVEL